MSRLDRGDAVERPLTLSILMFRDVYHSGQALFWGGPPRFQVPCSPTLVISGDGPLKEMGHRTGRLANYNGSCERVLLHDCQNFQQRIGFYHDRNATSPAPINRGYTDGRRRQVRLSCGTDALAA